MTKVGAVILAAGKGTRMKAKGKNKVTYKLGDKPMIVHAVKMLEKMQLSPIIIVVGYAKESVQKLFENNIIFAEQKKRLGTAHAALKAIEVLPKDTSHIFILNGDDSAFYTKDILIKLLKEHVKNKNAITFLTIHVKNPFGLGRVIREKEKVVAIVEEKDASPAQRKINEINPACYLFETEFIRKFIKKVPKSKITGEYYLMSLLEIALKENFKIEGIKGGRIPWRGVNTDIELKEAEKLFHKSLSSAS
jgi:bifunctional N-acetylglucosamine-1-phosphate-uridyltransferase/glucosamine-1-phosphate-acetyltransferase GlmU-like protein